MQKWFTMELEQIKVGKLQNQDVIDEYGERIKDSLGKTKQYACLGLNELRKVTKSLLVEEAKRKIGSKKKKTWLDFLLPKATNRVERKDSSKAKIFIILPPSPAPPPSFHCRSRDSRLGYPRCPNTGRGQLTVIVNAMITSVTDGLAMSQN
ncbi:hypothetical protein EVAR_11332_1 [Eumeta japonica]|uniref:Uncharacterized protein n=1 Tax=Eumeta variegata TaxID=151549 RepID=A0A4C1U0T2_EUMVA|nr:hypothetical protein EVAR_11332_1 [Eumeta japonica]